jgi:hypothetical protein
MIPKAEYLLRLDPEFNEGNKFASIVELIEMAQDMKLTEYTFEGRIVVHKKLADYFEGNPWQFTFTYNNTGLDNNHRGLVKIRFI